MLIAEVACDLLQSEMFCHVFIFTLSSESLHARNGLETNLLEIVIVQLL